MSQASNFGKFVLIFFFGGAVAAMGAHELQLRFQKKPQSAERVNRNLLQNIHGGGAADRARFSPEAMKKAQAAEIEEKDLAAQDDGDEAGSSVSGFLDKLVP